MRNPKNDVFDKSRDSRYSGVSLIGITLRSSVMLNEDNTGISAPLESVVNMIRLTPP